MKFKKGQIIVGGAGANVYSSTHTGSICRVIQKGEYGYIYVEIIKNRRDDETGFKFWVNSNSFDPVSTEAL